MASKAKVKGRIAKLETLANGTPFTEEAQSAQALADKLRDKVNQPGTELALEGESGFQLTALLQQWKGPGQRALNETKHVKLFLGLVKPGVPMTYKHFLNPDVDWFGTGNFYTLIQFCLLHKLVQKGPKSTYLFVDDVHERFREIWNAQVESLKL